MIKIIIIKLRDKDHHTFSYGPNLLLNSQPHIYFIVVTYHIHIFSSHQRKEKRERGESEVPVEIVVHKSKASRDRGR